MNDDHMINVEHEHTNWLSAESDAAALIMRQRLVPIEGPGAIIFPPTYPMEQDKAGYNIDRFDDRSSVCQIDSVGSQANRMEPIFKRERYKHLVPQVVIAANDRNIHILDAGHRAADAIVRFSTLGPRLHEAFRAYQAEGDAVPLARIAPTSIVFGSWDSRATQAKLPRIVRSVIRAYNVNVLRRSAQYSTIAGEILEGDDGDAEVTTKGPKAELGLAHVPAVHTHGGIEVLGEIRRDAILNLSTLRMLAGPAERGDILKLRRYIFGLALVCFTAPMEPFLREGCELVPDPDQGAVWKLVKYDGTRTDLIVSHDQALAIATTAAAAFGVKAEVSGKFEPGIAKKVLALNDSDRKKLLRHGPITQEAIEGLGKKRSRAKDSDQI
ncbi:MAG TPA: type I-U CRISPR-associated RAMP protein Csb1/Cas7u [Dehalococcoidia bacterium]|jgi:CRISPR-associated protein Csb1|nr:type I-U CRISPR-associated RAMP protein Csb1/Cas7u [Dehalococcoidia bacterium]